MEKNEKREERSCRKTPKNKINKSLIQPVIEDIRDDENTWECSVCTFRNSAEAFKCLMCDVRKGTSTRKPRINPELVAQQVARQQQQIQQRLLKANAKLAEKEAKKDEKILSSPSIGNSTLSGSGSGGNMVVGTGKKKTLVSDTTSPGPSIKIKKSKKESNGDGNKNFSRPKLRNVDRNNCSSEAVTVNNVTVIITEFQPKKKSDKTIKKSQSTDSKIKN